MQRQYIWSRPLWRRLQFEGRFLKFYCETSENSWEEIWMEASEKRGTFNQFETTGNSCWLGDRIVLFGMLRISFQSEETFVLLPRPGAKKMDSKRVVLLGTCQILPLREYRVPSSYFRVTSDWNLFFIFTIELQNTSTARFTADFLLHFLAKWFRFGLFQQIRVPSTRYRVSLAERVAD